MRCYHTWSTRSNQDQRRISLIFVRLPVRNEGKKATDRQATFFAPLKGGNPRDKEERLLVGPQTQVERQGGTFISVTYDMYLESKVLGMIGYWP